jgi:signal transduction histidine kinase
LTQKREVQLAPLDINETVTDVVRMATGDALNRRVEIECVLAENLPMVAADRVTIEQVLLNLIVNGMDAMREVSPSARRLTVRTRHDADDAVVVSVVDRGHGIPPDKWGRLFESFFTTKTHGIGLGLSIARSIIEAHHGRIWAESPATGGAAFHFSLRCCEEMPREG